MAQVSPEDIVKHLSSEFTRALMDALKDILPDAQVDEREFFRAFKKGVHRRCGAWEQVPDSYVKTSASAAKD